MGAIRGHSDEQYAAKTLKCLGCFGTYGSLSGAVVGCMPVIVAGGLFAMAACIVLVSVHTSLCANVVMQQARADSRTDV